MEKIKRHILLNPGPATTTDSVKYAQVVPDICPREKDFQKLMEGIRHDLVKIVNGNDEYTCVLFGGSGTAVMEATLSSIIAPKKKILILINGAYGKRMGQITNAYGIPTVPYEIEWGTAFNWNNVEETLKIQSDIKYLAMVHHETTTGILNPLEPFALLAETYKLMTVVDTISSFAGIPINVNKTPIDFLMSTSNKCIQGMAGVAFVICNKSALMKIKHFSSRSFYLNLYDEYEFIERTGQMRFTPPVQVIYALRQAIDEYFEEGGENRWGRYQKSYQILIEGLKQLGFQFLLGNDVTHSQILTTIYEPDHPNYNFNELHDRLYERGFTIYPGKVTDKRTFRLSVMGAIDYHDIREFLKAFKEVLNEMDVEMVYSGG